MSLRPLQLFILSFAAFSAAQNFLECRTGTFQCCSSVQPAGNSVFSTLFALVGIPPSTVSSTTPCGINCNSVLPVPGNTGCTRTLVCCLNANFGGLVAIGCKAPNIAL
ncbi:hypothetical protein GALMADRAFT_144791 [Galerina marginata CBS 339.88]|uniref:Hydrophobin n=1 Tax=Galerina marginata (strain CBS 339.88) TaxID=685588 RepID=A0A067SI09_GALM3|nr:hypothetical protein GALMADRAFT_144791 [Galerina marginata CBS 339.88]